MRNKIINGILIVSIFACVAILLVEFFTTGTVSQRNLFKAVTIIVALIIAIVQPGKAKPPFDYYREQYEFIGDGFVNENEQKLMRDGIYWYNRKKYKKALNVFNKLISTGDILSKEEDAVNIFIDSCNQNRNKKQM